jgi:hypothetical protein
MLAAPNPVLQIFWPDVRSFVIPRMSRTAEMIMVAAELFEACQLSKLCSH